MNIELRPITAEQTRLLRSSVLRPHQSPDELIYDGDDAPESLHLGAFLNGNLVGIASVCQESIPGEDDPTAWRLRGMAIVPEVRGQGVGRALLERCVEYIVERGGTMLWCHGRSSVAGFYQALGFELYGEEFEIEVTGPHYVMKRKLEHKL